MAEAFMMNKSVEAKKKNYAEVLMTFWVQMRLEMC